MFIEAIHIVDNSERVANRVGSVIRLQFFDTFKRNRTCDSFYFSFVSRRSIFVPGLVGRQQRVSLASRPDRQ